ncbi:MAG: MarR family transcriptional regulator [Actinomycetota bacterium]|nr:MarR family transcriptional regulator [Actinomycetota bacterium]MDQ3629645.1 MarR family transcriptional regulator [Actinomycetota bacterium]
MTRPARRDVPDADVVSWWGLVLEGFHRTHRHVGVGVEAAVGLTQAPAEVLLRLVRTPGFRLPMSQVARECALSSGGFTKVADKLVRRGLIHRVPSDQDRRVIYAELTTDGVRVARDAESATAQALRAHLIDVLGTAEAQALGELMRRLRDAN